MKKSFLISLVELVAVLSTILLSSPTTVSAFSVCTPTALHQQHTTLAHLRRPTSLNAFFGGKKDDDDEDLSFIETRDMTREEMAEYNRRFENTVNQELIGMTVFSLIISLPLLYLAWVGLFSETAEIASDFSDLPYN